MGLLGSLSLEKNDAGTDCNEKLLQEIYRCASAGRDSIIGLMDKARDAGLRGELTSQLESLRRYADEAGERLAERGLKPKDESGAGKTGAKLGRAVNTLLDTTTSRVAEVIINSANDRIMNLEKQLNSCSSANSAPASPEALALAQDFIKSRKKDTDKLGEYL